MVNVVPREQWGAVYRTGFNRVGMQEKDEFFVHYHGGVPRYDRGAAMAKEVESIHHGNGWSGVGYSFLVGQDGRAYEGRGWDGVCVACPNHNTRGIHVYVAIGGDQEATDEAKATVIALRDEHRARRAAIHRTAPAEYVHGDKYPTACAGPTLTPWVHAGMPAPDGTTTEEDPLMGLVINLTDFQKDAIGTKDGEWEVEKILGYLAGQAALARRYSGRAATDAAVARALAEESAKKGTALSDEDIARVAAEAAKRTADELGDDFEAVGDVKLVKKPTTTEAGA